MNIQRITSSNWSYYLLKYAMKCEPQSTIILNVNSAKRLGLQNLTKLQLKLISTTIMTKPVISQEATLKLLANTLNHKKHGDHIYQQQTT